VRLLPSRFRAVHLPLCRVKPGRFLVVGGLQSQLPVDVIRDHSRTGVFLLNLPAHLFQLLHRIFDARQRIIARQELLRGHPFAQLRAKPIQPVRCHQRRDRPAPREQPAKESR
jgi:hypothetical protein